MTLRLLQYEYIQLTDCISELTMATSATTNPSAEGPAPPLYVDTQHEDLVHDVQMDFYGSKMATCSSGT